jgi:hypothetical protein
MDLMRCRSHFPRRDRHAGGGLEDLGIWDLLRDQRGLRGIPRSHDAPVGLCGRDLSPGAVPTTVKIYPGTTPGRETVERVRALSALSEGRPRRGAGDAERLPGGRAGSGLGQPPIKNSTIPFPVGNDSSSNPHGGRGGHDGRGCWRSTTFRRRHRLPLDDPAVQWGAGGLCNPGARGFRHGCAQRNPGRRAMLLGAGGAVRGYRPVGAEHRP